MRHILLLLPFLLDGLLADEVLEHNRSHPLNPVLDLSQTRAFEATRVQVFTVTV